MVAAETTMEARLAAIMASLSESRALLASSARRLEEREGQVATTTRLMFGQDRVREKTKTKPLSSSLISTHRDLAVGALHEETVLAPATPTRCSTNCLASNVGNHQAAVAIPASGMAHLPATTSTTPLSVTPTTASLGVSLGRGMRMDELSGSIDASLAEMAHLHKGMERRRDSLAWQMEVTAKAVARISGVKASTPTSSWATHHDVPSVSPTKSSTLGIQIPAAVVVESTPAIAASVPATPLLLMDQVVVVDPIQVDNNLAAIMPTKCSTIGLSFDADLQLSEVKREATPCASRTVVVLDGDLKHDVDPFTNEDYHGVLTHVGGMSLFLELGLDSAADKFSEQPFKDMAWDVELADTHDDGVSLFRDLVLASTQPCCRSVFISGFKEKLHMMKNDDELCEQWDPGILLEKTFRLAVHDVDRTKRLFVGSKFQILEAIGSERPAPWPSWRYCWCGELPGFQSNGSIHALGDTQKRIWLAPWPLPLPLPWSWFICYLTGVRLKQPTAEMRHITEVQLVEVKTCMHDLDKAEIAYCIGFDLPRGDAVTRLHSGAWLLSYPYHGVVVHTGCQLSRALKYKIRTREQQKHGGIAINYGCKDFIFLLGWMDVGMINACWLHLILSWMTPQLILLFCVDTTYTWEPRGVANVGAKYSQHAGRTIVSLLDHEQNATVFVVIPALILSLQGQQGLVLLIDREPQAVYWITIMPFVTCVEVFDAHVQWDPGGFLSIMSGECELARQPQGQSGNDKLLQPEHAIAWGQAMFCRGGSVTPGVLSRLHMRDGLPRWARPNRSSLGEWRIKRESRSTRKASNRNQETELSLPSVFLLDLFFSRSGCYHKHPRVWCYHKHLVSISRHGSRRWPRDMTIWYQS